MNITKIYFFEKIRNFKKIAKLTRREREKTQINKLRDKKGDIPHNITKIQEIIRGYLENYISMNWKIQKTLTNF